MGQGREIACRGRAVKRGSLVPLAWAVATAASAEPPALMLSGEVRARIEEIDNQARAGVAEAESLFNLRTIVNLTVGRGPVRIGGTLIDSRIYAPGPRSAATTNEVNALEPVQAWAAVDLDGRLGAGSRLKVAGGRFTMDVGSRRLIANDDYRNTTNAFTGLKADWSTKAGWSGTAFYTLPQIRLPEDGPSVRRNAVRIDREGFDFRLAGFLVARSGLPGRTIAEVAAYRLDERDLPDRATRDRHLTSLTARLVRPPAPGTVHFEAEYIRQTGSIRESLAPAAARRAVGAWFAHASVGYSWPLPWQPRLTLEYDQASGDRRQGRYNRFDTLFGMRRADLGPAGLYFAIGRTNLLSPAVRLEVAPTKRLDAFVAWRGLWLASPNDAFSSTGVRDATGAAGRHAGNEIDARVRWWAVPRRLRLEADGTYLAKGRFYRLAPNSPGAADTRYWSLNATTFF